MKIANKRVLIVGASSGIGLETANYLATLNYDIIVSSRTKSKECNEEYLYVDISDEKSVKELFLGIDRLDAIVYSVGITTGQKNIKEFSKDLFNKIMDVNVTGVLLCLKYAYELLKLSRGKIVIVNSLASRTYSQFSGVEYTVSKSALNGVVKQLSQEFAKDGILINSVMPSMTATPMLMENVDKTLLKSIENKIPLGRIANSLEIAKAIEFLISDKNTYITGSGLDINGGQYLDG